MRLRYLHLPRCGPLTDTAVVFGREELIAKVLDLERPGSLNFIVGVNGSGKSSLLRALYHLFRSLNLRERPPLPVTVAWDRDLGNGLVTVLLHFSYKKDEPSFFAILQPVENRYKRCDWEEITAALGDEGTHPMVNVIQSEFGPDAITHSSLWAHLPKRLIAYTSGADDFWVQLDHPALHLDEEGVDETAYQAADERPPGWSMDREWEEEQPVRISNLLTRRVLQAEGTSLSLPEGAGQVGTLSGDMVARLMQELGPLNEIRRKVWSNQQGGAGRQDDSHFRIRPRHLR